MGVKDKSRGDEGDGEGRSCDGQVEGVGTGR